MLKHLWFVSSKAVSYISRSRCRSRRGLRCAYAISNDDAQLKTDLHSYLHNNLELFSLPTFFCRRSLWSVQRSIKQEQSNYAAHYTFGIVTVILPSPYYAQGQDLKTEVSLWKWIKCFPFTLRRKNLKMQQSSDILFSNPSGFRGVLKKLRLLSGLVWRISVTD